MKKKIILATSIIIIVTLILFLMTIVRRLFFISSFDLLVDSNKYILISEYLYSDRIGHVFKSDRSKLYIYYNDRSIENCSNNETYIESYYETGLIYSGDFCTSKNRKLISSYMNRFIIDSVRFSSGDYLYTGDGGSNFYIFGKRQFRNPYNYLYKPTGRNLSGMNIYETGWNTKYIINSDGNPVQVVNKYWLISPMPGYYKSKNFE